MRLMNLLQVHKSPALRVAPLNYLNQFRMNPMNKKLISIFCITGLLFMNSCTTYLIPLDSFKHQLAGIDSTDLKQVTLQDPYGIQYFYLANPIEKIQCLDKKGNPSVLPNGPSIEIRFTHGEKNRKTVFYFDRIFVSDSSVVGVQSRFISAIRKTIPLESITRIEVQDGKKKFKYVGQ